MKLRIGFPTLHRGDTYVIEVEERQDAGAAGALGFSPMHVFAASEPIGKDLFEVAVDKEMKLTWVARRMGKMAQPEITKVGRMSTWRWSIEALEPEKKELLAPPLLRRAPVVRTTLLSNWQPVSQWLGGLLKENIRPTAEIAQLALLLAANKESDLDKIRAVHGGLKDRLRHVGLNVSTAVDLAGHKAEQVLQRGYGDCVDRAVLLSALLRAVDVSCEPVFLCTKGHRAFDPEIATPYCGDHCIVKTEGRFGTLFFDPGSSYHRLGELPALEQDVIAYSPISSSMYRTPASTSGDNGVDVEIEGDIKPSGAISGVFTLEGHGEDEAQLRKLCETTSLDERNRRICSFLRFPSKTIISSLKLNQKPTALDKPFKVQGCFSIAKAGDELGELLVLSPPGHRATSREVAPTKRCSSILYRVPTTHRIHSTFSLPQDLQILLAPEGLKIESEAASFERRVSTKGDKLVIDDIYERKKREVEADVYSAFKDLLERRASSTIQPLVLRHLASSKTFNSATKSPRFEEQAEASFSGSPPS